MVRVVHFMLYVFYLSLKNHPYVMGKGRLSQISRTFYAGPEKVEAREGGVARLLSGMEVPISHEVCKDALGLSSSKTILSTTFFRLHFHHPSSE